MRLFLDPRDYARWSACPGQPALSEADAPPKYKSHPAPAIDDVLATHKARGAAVEVILGDRLDLSLITGERGAQAVCDALLIVTEGESATLEIWHTDTALKGVPIYFDSGHPTDEARILALAAMHKYALVQNFTATNCGTLAELQAFSEELKARAALSLDLRTNVAALANLIPGDYCKTCPAAYRCPALAKDVHEAVFGEIQALDEPILTILPLNSRADAQGLTALISDALQRRIPLIEAWIAAVRAEALSLGLVERPEKSVASGKRRKKHRRGRHKGQRGRIHAATD